MAKNKSKDMRVIMLRRLNEAVTAHQLFRDACLDSLIVITKAAIQVLRNGKSIYLFGNGGSAADAQHIAAELQGHFYKYRKPMPVVALTTNTSTLTAIGNDYRYELIFARQVAGSVRRGDMVIGLSTSGNSANVLAAVREAKRLKAITVGFTGGNGGKLKRTAEFCLQVPSSDVARIQECHITAGHIMCEIIEDTLGR